MTLEDVSDAHGKRFLISSTDPHRLRLSFICAAANDELHLEWVETIKYQLQKQFDFMIAIKDPIAWQKTQKN